MGKHSRTKGAGGERELCALLSDAFGEKITRKLGQARDSGHDVDLPPFNIECKRRARVGNLYEWMQQANVPFTTQSYMPVPMVALRADGREWLVVMRLPDWIKLAREEVSKP
jgi:hypothetical protein